MARITLLDGGMGQELVRRAGDAPTPLWATQVMFDHPGLVAEVHGDYFDAGATIATTNTYAVHHDRLIRAGLDAEFGRLMEAGLQEAEAARAKAGAGRIAGSIGPLGASYRPDLHPDHAEAVARFAEIVGLLTPRVDLILFETVASLDQARAALEAGRTSGKPVWLSITLEDGDGSKLRSGEDVAAALELAAEGGAAAILANCSVPEAMAAAMEIFAAGDLPFGAYANGFTHISSDFLNEAPTVDSLAARSDLSPETYAEFAMGWIGQGATIVGGCCEVGPAHIAALHKALVAAGHEIV